MAYIALYRKYRSQSFSELMGQDAVTTVLQNSLRSGRIAHAYLFYGARGCGKTSTARLLSRALNCVAQDAPTPEPCGVCRLCTAIRDASCMDVVEIDAASETGVDNVREKIIENVQYVPTEARYKVYIIDEVHDLSAKAFDALLKTLEEPPPHVVFILATTEHHKVPITIRSRCIPFQFKRGTLADLSAAIERVVIAEGFAAEPAAIRAIARCAEGSWRDALSLLEQVISFSDEAITEETVQQALGTVGSETLGRVVDTIAKDNWSETLGIAGDLVDSGKDVRQLITALSGYLRDLLLIASGAVNTAAQELGPEKTDQLTPQAKLFSSRQLLTMLSTLAVAEKEVRLNNQHRWLLERTLCMLMPANVAVAERPAQVSSPRVSTAAPSLPEATAYRPPAAARAQPPQPAPQYRPPTAPPASQPSAAPKPEAAPVDEPPGDSRFVGEVTFEVLKRAWPRVAKAIDKVSPSAASFLQKAEVVSLEGKIIGLAFSESYARDRIMEKGKALVEKKINEVLQSEGFRIVARHDGDNDGGRGSGGGGTPPPVSPSPSGTAPPQTSLLEETLQIFGGEVIRSDPQSASR